MSNTNLKKYNIYQIGTFLKGNENNNDKDYVEINKDYLTCMEGLKVDDKITLLFWFDKSDNEEKRSVMRVHPRGNVNIPERGVFATRSPMRPNPIALYDIDIANIDFEKGIIYLKEEIDAFNETPLIDIKISKNCVDFKKYEKNETNKE
ncbi:tRNA (N6-threonylcarbamoyladenosine(37)-N6)-methyltransferase TrmO [Methanococcus voltae]|uniref:TsaA-like domain-containing protein n=1 Tax=Methanococcus voltae (strain ATCC BAA-1334 / A3) TaxID=456320 RepID=D7DR62_METV3|nr:tRNA (N6-threonylcarbamoyladenosine(37)-N6)-methyltransferase TrmO [Methanococcus voltae]MCS3900999.1 tRNA-Thr(GGU) m(6)t(6)A37 methyltransferase TsaA [Methanococcus voltae]